MTYDTFCFFNELDLLEIRLNILDPYVDKFVICEAEVTFSGLPKPLYYYENRERFAKWKDKIIHLVPPPLTFPSSFDTAGFQKDYIRVSLAYGDDSTIYFGDLDEIWKPQEIKDDKIYNLKQLNYSYYLNNRSSEEWVGTVVGKYKTFKTNTVNHWRGKHDNVIEGGWHFTNMGGHEQILKKLESYDHAFEANIPWVRDNLAGRIENGEDYLGRDADWKGNTFKMWTDDSELPQYLKDNKDKWIHLFKS